MATEGQKSGTDSILGVEWRAVSIKQKSIDRGLTGRLIPFSPWCYTEPNNANVAKYTYKITKMATNRADDFGAQASDVRRVVNPAHCPVERVANRDVAK